MKTKEEILCDECRLTREPHEHRCLEGGCQCERCHPYFNPDKAERTAYEFTCKFSYGGFLESEYSSDKHTKELSQLLQSYSDQQLAEYKTNLEQEIEKRMNDEKEAAPEHHPTGFYLGLESVIELINKP